MESLGLCLKSLADCSSHRGAEEAGPRFFCAAAVVLCCRAGGSQLLSPGSGSLWGRKRGAASDSELLVTGVGNVKIPYPNISRQKDLKLISIS